MAGNCGLLLLLLALSGGYFAVSRAQDNRCEQGWKYYGGSCYYREKRKEFMVSWRASQAVCQSQQANLVTVNDDNEQKFLESILEKNGSWCGLNNIKNLSVLEWVSGEKSGYTNWAPNQPVKDVNKRCAKIQFTEGQKWIMRNCRKKHKYTCEKAARPRPCASMPCKNGGTCIEQGDGYLCQCSDRFTGKQCETLIPTTPPNPCASMPCQNGGTCIELNGQYLCQCSDRFTGKQCETLIPTTPPSPCASMPCQNGGTCIERGDGYLCQCPDRFTGKQCETLIPTTPPSPCASMPCQNGGTCIEQGNGYLCQCPDRFTGKQCETLLVPCPAGQFSETGLGPNCQYCPRDTYQDKVQQKNCIPCPNGTSTLRMGADSLSKCGARPKIKSMKPKISNIKEGESVSVSCYASGIPTPTYYWKFLRDIPPNFLGKMSQASIKNADGDVIGSKMTISGAMYENTGSYECHVTNSHGEDKSLATINVKKVILSRSTDSCKAQVKLIYHQTMTPTWLEAHASFIDSSRTSTGKQLTFNVGAVDHAALLKVPMIPAGVLKVSTSLTIQITVAHDISIGGHPNDSDIRYGVSDGTKFVGFETCDKGNYGSNAPCYGSEGVSGAILSSLKYNPVTPKPSDSFYPGQYVFTFKLDERWGSCYTAHDGGFVKTAGYNNRLVLDKGLTLEVYKSDKAERVGIRFIEVTIIQDDA